MGKLVGNLSREMLNLLKMECYSVKIQHLKFKNKINRMIQWQLGKADKRISEIVQMEPEWKHFFLEVTYLYLCYRESLNKSSCLQFS